MMTVRRWPSTRSASRPPKHRREIDEAGVEAVDLRGERLDAERAEHAFEARISERREPMIVVGVLGQQQVLHHVQHEQRAHAVVGEPLPHLGGEQEGQPARMAEPGAASVQARVERDIRQPENRIKGRYNGISPSRRRLARLLISWQHEG